MQTPPLRIWAPPWRADARLEIPHQHFKTQSPIRGVPKTPIAPNINGGRAVIAVGGVAIVYFLE